MPRLAFILAWLLLFWVAPILALRGATDETSMPIVTDFKPLLDPGKHRLSLQVDGHDRTVYFVTPTGFKPGQALPLVIFLHGAGGSALHSSHIYGWAEKAEAENFFVAFPEGLPVRPDAPASFLLNPHIWRDRRAGMLTHGIDDVHFIGTLLDQLEAALPIDAQRVYITGFSNGAGMTFTLAARFANRIAAIAPVSSQSFAEAESLPRPMPIYYLAGTADPLIPYHGGTVTLPWGNTHSSPPVQETVDTWVKLDGLPAQPQVVSDEKGVRVERYGPGANGAEIVFTTIEGNGHHWPGTVEPLPARISGPVLDPFNATDRIWAFFQTHSLK